MCDSDSSAPESLSSNIQSDSESDPPESEIEDDFEKMFDSTETRNKMAVATPDSSNTSQITAKITNPDKKSKIDLDTYREIIKLSDPKQTEENDKTIMANSVSEENDKLEQNNLKNYSRIVEIQQDQIKMKDAKLKQLENENQVLKEQNRKLEQLYAFKSASEKRLQLQCKQKFENRESSQIQSTGTQTDIQDCSTKLEACIMCKIESNKNKVLEEKLANAIKYGSKLLIENLELKKVPEFINKT